MQTNPRGASAAAGRAVVYDQGMGVSVTFAQSLADLGYVVHIGGGAEVDMTCRR